MSVGTRAWEQSLLALAHEGQAGGVRENVDPAAKIDAARLEAAYQRATAVTAEHSRSFYLASGLLPDDKRRAVRALYAFCRVSDDLVDRPQTSAPAAALEAWRERALGAALSDDPVVVAWTDARRRYDIPTRYAEQLIDGVARDLDQQRYETFDDLATYCYGVASTVGLMSMHIVGFRGPAAVPYAIKLGLALQLTNILRDVGQDWAAGRLYLPAEELAAFGLSEDDIAARRVDRRWRAFMRAQIRRNRRLYDEAWPGIAALHPDGRLAVAAAADIYRAILDDIEANDYDVFRRRAYVSAWGKLRRLPALWWSVRRMRPATD